MLHSFGDKLDLIASQMGVIVLVASLVFVMVKGGPAERAAALLVALTWLGLLAAQHLTREMVPDVPFLISDVVLAVGFLVLAIRFASLWLGGAMILEAALFFLHANHFTDQPAHNYGYLVAVNVLSYCVLTTVVGAAAASWIKRVRTRRAAARAAEAPKSAASVLVTAP